VSAAYSSDAGILGARHDTETGMSRENLDVFARDREGVIARIKAGLEKG